MGNELTRLEPQSISEALSIAEMAVRSRLYAVQSTEAAMMILLTGRDLGLTATQAFRGIYVVSGKPVVSSDAMVAAIRRSGLCASWRVIESTAERCVVTTLRAGETESETETWTTEDAKRAGLAGKDVWKAYPRDMLRHRAQAALARRVYPDVILGCYAPGEMREDEQATSALRVDVSVEPQAPALGAGPGWIDRIAAATTGKALVALAADLDAAQLNGSREATLAAYAAQWERLIARAADAGSLEQIARVWNSKVPAKLVEELDQRIDKALRERGEELAESAAIASEDSQ